MGFARAAVHAYRVSETYPGRLTLFRAAVASEGDLGWGRVSAQVHVGSLESRPQAAALVLWGLGLFETPFLGEFSKQGARGAIEEAGLAVKESARPFPGLFTVYVVAAGACRIDG